MAALRSRVTGTDRQECPSCRVLYRSSLGACPNCGGTVNGNASKRRYPGTAKHRFRPTA